MFLHRMLCAGLFLTTVSGSALVGEEQPPKPADDLPKGALARLGNARFLNHGRVFALAYSPDGRLLASGAWDGSIRLWDTVTRQERFRMDAHKGSVHKLAFSADGKWLASAGSDPGVCLWDVGAGQLRKILQPDQKHFSDVAFSPDGKSISGIGDGTLYLWDNAGNGLGKQGGDRLHMHCVFRGPGTLACAYIKPFARFDVGKTYSSSWSIAPAKELDSQELGELSPDRLLTFDPDGRLLAFHTIDSFGRLEHVKYVHAEPGSPARPIRVEGENISFLCVSPDRRMLALSGEPWGLDGQRGRKFIRVWEISTGTERCRFECPDEGRLCLAFSPDGRALASGNLDVTTLLWDLTGRDKQEPSRAPLTVAEINKLWDELKSEDGATAYRAHWKLVQAPEQAAAFLAKTLRPPELPDPKRVAKLVRDLADGNFSVRQQATAELLKLEELCQPVLLETLRAGRDLEVQRRIENLLRQIREISPEKLRQLRAVEALEHMRTFQADELLRNLARGAPAARLTREAIEAWQRRERGSLAQNGRS